MIEKFGNPLRKAFGILTLFLCCFASEIISYYLLQYAKVSDRNSVLTCGPIAFAISVGLFLWLYYYLDTGRNSSKAGHKWMAAGLSGAGIALLYAILIVVCVFALRTDLQKVTNWPMALIVNSLLLGSAQFVAIAFFNPLA